MRHRVSACSAIFTLALTLVFAASASAKTHTFTVKTKSDVVHGSCAKKCSLRDAIIAADKLGGDSVITVPKGTYKLAIVATDSTTPPAEDNPTVGDLNINSGTHVTIKGAGASKTILNANFIDRLFSVANGASLTIDGATIENGDQPDEPPSVYSDAATAIGEGGAFYNDGSLTIDDSILRNNSAYNNGGAIFSDHGARATTIENSSATANTADDPGAVIDAVAGKITLRSDTFTRDLAYSGGAVIFGTGVAAVTISHVRAVDDTGDDSGGVISLRDAGRVSISHSQFSHDSGDGSGGVIFIAQTDNPLSISDSTFSRNVADFNGGAVAVQDSDRLSVRGSKFSDNAAQGSGSNTEGGAIAAESNNISVSSSHFTGNSAQDAGAIYVDGSATTASQSITTSVFSDNGSTNAGAGAVDDEYGDLAISSSTFDQNTADGVGGGLYYDSGDGLSLINDTFDSNYSPEGGAIYLDNPATTGTIVLRNDTIARNQSYEGGGIENANYINTVVNTILAYNTGQPGRKFVPPGTVGDCYGPFDYDTSLGNYTGTADKGHNIDTDHSCVEHTKAPDDRTANPKLGPLRNNGGPVPTDALLKGSPAIGKADKAQCPKTDARGDKRSGKCDIGAYQTEPNKKRKKK